MSLTRRYRPIAIILIVLFITSFYRPPSLAASDLKLWGGQTVYVPCYSTVLIGDRLQPFNLTVTLNIRNTDLVQAITVLSVKYYDSNGKLVRNYLEKPVILNSLAATQFYVKESDTSGGLGACFIVKWKSEKLVNAPIIEGVMIGAASTQGISFVCPGLVIKVATK